MNTTRQNSSLDVKDKISEKEMPLAYVTKSYRSPKRSGSSAGSKKKIQRVPSSMKIIETDPQSISIGPSITNSESTHNVKGSTRISHTKGVLVDLLGKKSEARKSGIVISTSKTATGRRVEDNKSYHDDSDDIRMSSSSKISTGPRKVDQSLNIQGTRKRNPYRENLSAAKEENLMSNKGTFHENDIDRNDLDEDTKEESSTGSRKIVVESSKKRALSGLPRLSPALLQRYRDIASRLSTPIDSSLVFSG